MIRDIRKVAILGANGAMGSGAAVVFASAGLDVVMLARDMQKAERGRERAERMAKSDALTKHIELGTYDEDLDDAVAEADLVFEALAEDLALKQRYFREVDRLRKPDAIVATVSSGLSIAALAQGRSDGFRRNFLGIHLFNPPNVIVGCEVVPHEVTDPAVVRFVEDHFERRLGRKIVRTMDRPAFAGNRIGFKVLNETAQLAPEHGVGVLDMLIGPHTGRAMPPLSTIDFVGWDVHKAIVDNLRKNTNDEANAAFVLPAYMAELIARGHMGEKTPDKGGFFRKTKGPNGEVFVLDPERADYVPAREMRREPPAFVKRMRELIREGRYRDALRVLMDAQGREAELTQRIVLGYVAYALGRVGEVVESIGDVDRIMAFGFNWAPPGAIVDLLGPKEIIERLKRANMHVPDALVRAEQRGGRIFNEPNVDVGRFFYA